ncbi:MAG: KilA-N domain-containing protein, partial [Candidatus Omnitrophota bacterium]
METIQKFVFNNAEVDFQFDKNQNLMVNATEMAKLSGKRIDHFLKSDHAEAFISALEFTPFGGNSEPLTRSEIIKTKGQSGTWMHRLLALKFAAWIDPKFEVWVYSTIDFILFDYYKRIEESLKESAK